MRDFEDLKVWQRAHELVLGIYRATSHFPSEERFGLTTQVRRSAISIASNIAEGRGREGDKDFARFLAMAAGSASECQYQILLARDLGYLQTADFQLLEQHVLEVRKMLSAFLETLRAEG